MSGSPPGAWMVAEQDTMQHMDYLLWKWQVLRLSRGVRSPFELTWESDNLASAFFSYYGNNVSDTHTRMHTHNCYDATILLLCTATTFLPEFHMHHFWLPCSSLETKADLQAMAASLQGPPPHDLTFPNPPSRQKQITSTGISQQEAPVVQSCRSRSRVQQLRRWESFVVSLLKVRL